MEKNIRGSAPRAEKFLTRRNSRLRIEVFRGAALVKLTNLANGKSVEVRINDRGPFAKGRIIDVSRAAASVLGMVESGVARVQLELLSPLESSDDLVLQNR